MGFAMSVLLVLLKTCIVPTNAQSPAPCVGKYPLEPGVISKEVDAAGRCSTGGLPAVSTLKLHNWGLYYTPLKYYNAGCEEVIAVAYTKVNRPATLYHRQLAESDFFAKSHPKLFKKHQDGDFVQFPCHTVPVRKVHVWKNRILFVSLISKAAQGFEYIRDFDCDLPDEHGWMDITFSWKQIRQKIARDRVATAALTFLHSLAYSNFFCV